MDRIYTYQDLKNIQTFIYSLKRKAKALGITLTLDSKNKKVQMEGDFLTSGYFDSSLKRKTGELAVGTARSINTWLPVLVHESCHLDQWAEKTDLWKESENMYYNIFDDWLMGKKCNVKKAYQCIDTLKNLELDCEKRTIAKIQKYKLPIDIKECIQKANCYIFFYNRLKTTRKWVEGDLYKPEILSVIKTDWYESYDETPKEVEAMFKKYKI